jgi:hypothetical protein
MRADAAAGRGVAHHHIVESRVGHETEAAEQFAGGGQHAVDALHEQRPARDRQTAKLTAREGSVAHAPALPVALNQARFKIVAPGQGEQHVRPHQTGALRQRIAHQQWSFLPVAAEELIDLKAAETIFRHAKR